MENTCTIVMLPVINRAPSQCAILNDNPTIMPIKLSINSTTGYLKSENINFGLSRFYGPFLRI